MGIGTERSTEDEKEIIHYLLRFKNEIHLRFESQTAIPYSKKMGTCDNINCKLKEGMFGPPMVLRLGFSKTLNTACTVSHC